MLEGLDKIDWSKLAHAYGPAGDVPAQLRKLASRDPERRRTAMYDLHGNIWHQGTVYEATAAAVPFLIELVSSPNVEDRDEILIFLSELANGNSYCEVHQHLELLKDKAASDEWKTQMEKELDWVQRARDAVLAGRQVFLDFLEQRDSKLREASVYLLASLTRPEPETAEKLWSLFESETDERCRASSLIGFGRLATPEPVNQSLLLKVFVKADSKLERLVAALSLARLFPQELTRDVIQEMLSALFNPEPYEALSSSPWGIDGLELLLEGVLTSLEGEPKTFVENELERALADAIHPAALNAARVFLSMAFHKRPPNDVSMDDLNPLQQRLVRAMARNKWAWVRSVSGTPAKKPGDAIIFSLCYMGVGLQRLLSASALEAGTFPPEPDSMWSGIKRWLKKN